MFVKTDISEIKKKTKWKGEYSLRNNDRALAAVAQWVVCCPAN